MSEPYVEHSQPAGSTGVSAVRDEEPAPVVRTLEDLTRRVRAFAEERDWQQFHTPKNLAMALAGEVGELLAELQWLTPDQAAEVMDDAEAGSRVRAEIADVTIYLVRLADVLGVDLIRASVDKLADSARRYPVAESRGRANKSTRT